jgi:hypothetical protein
MGARRAFALLLIPALVVVVGAIAVAVISLPRPAAGGTCGPGNGSEAAIVAFFDPGSIGAGPEPAVGGTIQGLAAHNQWEAFVGECQSAANARMLLATALLTAAVILAFAAYVSVRRLGDEPARETSRPQPGWYPDPGDPGHWRWWDGSRWGERAPPARGDDASMETSGGRSWSGFS